VFATVRAGSDYLSVVSSVLQDELSALQVEVFCVVTPCSVSEGYEHFEGSCCLHPQGEVNDARNKRNIYIYACLDCKSSVVAVNGC
jgi:hypothetical protein